MPEGSPELAVENVVASSSIEQEVDLEAVTDEITAASFDPDEFPGLIYRSDTVQATVLLFRSGNLTCTGASSRDQITAVLQEFYSTLDALGLAVSDEPDPTIQNLVTTADLNQTLTLSAIAIGLGLEYVEYEPEQFPGLVYRPPERTEVALLFGSGKIVLTGATNLTDADRTLETVQTELRDLDLLE